MSGDPLSEAELDELSDFLDSLPDDAMNIEMLDGLFSALICAPELVALSEYLPMIWGADFDFATDERGAPMLDLMLRHWNTIALALFRTLEEPDIYNPVLLLDEDGVVRGNDWATGFMLGVELRHEQWDVLFNDAEHAGLVVPLLMLFNEHNPDPERRTKDMTPELREQLIEYMIGALPRIYAYFDPYRIAATYEMPIHREAPKVGRNEPCPCGSGKKYKKCCGRDAPDLH
jgi:uncharacterized protein